MEIYYKIVGFDNMIRWFIKHNDYLRQFENIMQIHNNNPNYNLGTFISSNTSSKYKIPLVGKLILLIDKSNKKLAGSAVGELETSAKIYISNVFVHEMYRGKKLCQNMIQKLIESYDNVELKFVLDVNKLKISAIKCYENVGFKILQEKHFFKDGVKSFYYIMEK